MQNELEPDLRNYNGGRSNLVIMDGHETITALCNYSMAGQKKTEKRNGVAETRAIYHIRSREIFWPFGKIFHPVLSLQSTTTEDDGANTLRRESKRLLTHTPSFPSSVKTVKFNLIPSQVHVVEVVCSSTKYIFGHGMGQNNTDANSPPWTHWNSTSLREDLLEQVLTPHLHLSVQESFALLQTHDAHVLQPEQNIVLGVGLFSVME